jgi:SAM-dependent methyltransferase
MAAFWGELYLRSTTPFLSAKVTGLEVLYLDRAFQGVHGPIADLGCGHGRHASLLARRGHRVVGLDLDERSLVSRAPGFPAVRADLRALPFRAAGLAGAFAWYSTLFVFEDGEHPALLRGIARCLAPSGLLVFHTVPVEQLFASPRARFESPLPDGSHVVDDTRFDASSGRVRGVRTLTTPEGRVLSAPYAIRYYPLPELHRLFESAGLRVKWVHGDLSGADLSSDSVDLILGAERRDG